MRTNLYHEIERKLTEQGLAAHDLIGALLNALAFTHVPAGMYAGSEMEQRMGMDMMLGGDIQVTGDSPPRSLLERLVLRIRASYVVNKHNLANTRDNHHADDPVLARQVTCEEIWLWILKETVNIAEHHGLKQMVELLEWQKRQKGNEEGQES